MGDPLVGHDVALIRAPNPGPLTLGGTNTWIVGRDPCWIIDPGPDLPEHLDAIVAAAAARGGAGGIAVTHDHYDHAQAVPALQSRLGVPVAAARHPGDVALRDGDAFGPLQAIATPGHAPDHLAFAVGEVIFSGDAVLGEGTAFLFPDPGALRDYLAALERLRARRPALIGPGHGALVTDPAAKLDAYIAHRLDRERALVTGLASGRRTIEELLDAAWADVPAPLRPVAAVTLATHLDKLEDEGRLPAGVQRPDFG